MVDMFPSGLLPQAAALNTLPNTPVAGIGPTVAGPSTWQRLSSYLYNPAGVGPMSGGFDNKGNTTINPAEEKVLGMNMNQFGSIMGQMAGAVNGNPDSWQSKIGGLAASLGKAQLAASVEQNRHNAMMKTTKEILGSATPSTLGKLSQFLKLTGSNDKKLPSLLDGLQGSPIDPAIAADMNKGV